MRWHSRIRVWIELTCSALWLTIEEDTELQGDDRYAEPS